MPHSLFIFGAESASGIDALGINPKALVIQLITFLLVYLVLRRFAFAPILKVLEERRNTIESGVALGEEMRAERASLDKKIADSLHEARRSADEIIAQANDAAKQNQRDAEEKARQKAEGIVADAHTRAEQDAQAMRVQLKSEFVGLVSEATEAIIGEKVDAKKDATLIDQALKGQRAS